MALDTPRPAERAGADPARHRFTLFVGASTVALLAAGGLVTSTGSGLAVPDWPLSFGRLFPPMIGGVLYEHGHRMVAAFVGLLTLVLAAWYQWREPRPAIRRLALAALGAVIAQGILGGATVLLRLPVAISVAHACLAQAFFGLVVALSVLTAPRAGDDRARDAGGLAPPRWLGVAATGLVFGQVVLGAILRHSGAGLAIPDVPLAFGRVIPPMTSAAIALHFSHRVGALLVAAAVIALAVRVLSRNRNSPDLVKPVLLAVLLVAAQIVLGGITVVTRLAVWPATAHLVVGALLMAACLTFTLRAFRGAGVRRPAGARAGTARAVGPVEGGAAVGAARNAPALRARCADYLALTKPRVTSLVLATTAAGFYLGSPGRIDIGLLLVTLLGVGLAAAGTSALNQVVEREADARMRRTRERPLPAGRLVPRAALLFAIAISALGITALYLRVNALTAGLVAATLASYIFIYTPLKRRTSLPTLIGAVPGALPPLAGWTAAAGTIGAGGLAVFAILFMWQLPHSLAIASMYREDYARGGFRLLPVIDPEGMSTERQIIVQSLALLPMSLSPAVLGLAGQAYFYGALLLGLGLVAVAAMVPLRRTTRSARRMVLATVVYLPLLLGLLVLDRTAP